MAAASCRLPPFVGRVLYGACVLVLLLAVVFTVWAQLDRRPPAGSAAGAKPPAPGDADEFTGRPRLVVLTDIGNEPDDQMSFVRLLLYANELDLEGLVATTSTWQKGRVQPEVLRKLVAAYGEVRPNLLKHAAGWPEADKLTALVVSGQRGYGLAAVGADKTSPGAEAIIKAADQSDPRPLWVSIWGGANTLAAC